MIQKKYLSNIGELTRSESLKKKRSVGIHSGAFHADEVTACALLLVFDRVDRDKIIRSRELTHLSQCEYVCDVGGVYNPENKLFDHHQSTYEGELSSAGMVLLYLKDQKTLSEEAFDHFNQMLVLGVDAHDNGRATQEVGVCTFSHVIANFNPPVYEAKETELDEAFFTALDFAVGHIRRMHDRFLHNLDNREIVADAMQQDSLCLCFDKALPWIDSFFALGGESHPALFVLMPSRGQWKLRGIPPDFAHRMEVRLPFPKQWTGLLGEDLERASGIQGAIFCHKGGFTSVWADREGAVEALRKILNLNGIDHADVI